MIPRTWIIIGAGVALLGSNAITGCAVNRYVTSQWNAERARAKSDALEAARKIEQQRAEDAAKQAENARNLDAKYAKELQAATAFANDAAARYTERVRALQNRVNRCEAAGKAVDPSGTTGSSTGSADQRAEALGNNLAAYGRDYDKLASVVKACVAWAAEVGR